MDSDTGLTEWVGGREEFQNEVIFKSSGSSGLEKWVALSKEALEWSARSAIEYLDLSRGDVCGLTLPTVHVGGFGLVARAYFSGARLAEFPLRWSAAEFASWCALEKVSVSSLVPAQVRDLVDARCSPVESMRVIVVGGGALEPELAAAARELGWPVVPSYGMTETSSQVATGEGLPLLPGWEARLEDGSLALKGGGLLNRIITRVEGGFESHDPKVDGWFVTNDLAEITGRGLKILGRRDRRVKILGELVDLESLEKGWSEELGCPVAMIIKEDLRRGVSLWLLIEGKAEEMGRRNLARSGLERLSGWAFVERFPRSSLGKVDRLAMSEIDVEYVCANSETAFT